MKTFIVGLTSSSTLAEVQAVYDDNVDYDLDSGNATKARNFVIACRMLLRRLPGESSDEGTSMSLAPNLAEIRQQLLRAQQWIEANVGDVAGGVTHCSFKTFRD